MSNDDIAAAVLECVGGFENVAGNSLCATRLRISLRDMASLDRNALHSVKGVLGVVNRGQRGIEVIFGPNLVKGVYQSFKSLTGILSNDDGLADEPSSRPAANFQVSITPETPGMARRAPSPRRTVIEPDVIDDDTTALLEMLDETGDAS